MKKLHPLLSVLFLIYWGCEDKKNEYLLSQLEFLGDTVYKKFTEGELITGIVFQFYDLLKIQVGEVINGKIQGTWTEWYSNGNKKFVCHYDNQNKRDGTWTNWFEDGKVEIEVNYINGKKEGVSKIYFDSGKIKEISFYSNDLKDGVVELWRNDGSKRGTDNYSNGKKNGLSTRWYVEGDKMNEYVYDNGKKISSRCWDYRGQEVLCD